MNKIQFIELLKLRGITELNGKSIALAIEESGGEPTLLEMVEVNKASMDYYLGKYKEEQRQKEETNGKFLELNNKIAYLEEELKKCRPFYWK